MLLLALLVAAVTADPVLVNLQTVWRHGDRTPTSSYKTDPYNETFWGQPWGDLTTIGMEQHFLQGGRLRRNYVDKYGFLPKKYESNLISIRSAETPRCIQSAASNLAAFFAESQSTHPSDPAWPSSWTPMPIATMPHQMDSLMEPGVSCLHAEELLAKRAVHPQFLEYLATKSDLIETIAKNTGDTHIKVSDFKDIWHFYDTIIIEKVYRKLPVAAWVTDEFIDELREAITRMMRFLYGAADFGAGDDTELSKVYGGPLLKEMIENMNEAVNGKGKKWHVFSGHDSTVMAFLASLGAAGQVLPHNPPLYASTVAVELWRGDDGEYSVRILYSADANSNFKPITQYVTGCPQGDTCPLSTFIERSEKYTTKDLEKKCSKIL